MAVAAPSRGQAQRTRTQPRATEALKSFDFQHLEKLKSQSLQLYKIKSSQRLVEKILQVHGGVVRLVVAVHGAGLGTMLDDGAFEDEKTLLQLSHRVIADVLAGRSPTPNDTEHIVRSSTSSLRAHVQASLALLPFTQGGWIDGRIWHPLTLFESELANHGVGVNSLV